MSITTNAVFKCKNCIDVADCDNDKDIEFGDWTELYYTDIDEEKILEIIFKLERKVQILIPERKKFLIELKKNKINQDFSNE